MNAALAPHVLHDVIVLNVGSLKYVAKFSCEFENMDNGSETAAGFRWMTTCILHNYTEEYGHAYGVGLAVRHPKDEVNSKHAFFLALKRAARDLLAARILEQVKPETPLGLYSYVSTLDTSTTAISNAFA